MVKEYSVSIIIPCKNERDNIRPLLERLPAFGNRQEIIFVEGGSNDGTADELLKMKLHFTEKKIRIYNQTGTGKGDAVWLGFSKAENEILMILDADLSVSPEELPDFYQAIASGKGRLITGNRFAYPTEKQSMPWLNRMGNRLFAFLLSRLLGRNIGDSLCGTKVLFRDDYEKISKQIKPFENLDPFGDFSLILGAVKLEFKIIEIPVKYRARLYGKTKTQRFKHGWLLLRMIYRKP